MIDQRLKKSIMQEASASYEQIATDLNACGEACPEDAVEPTVWNMWGGAGHYKKSDDIEADLLEIQNIIRNPNHPDREEFWSIVQEAVKRYF